MAITLFDKLREELNRAKKENPVLDKDLQDDVPSKLLEKSIIGDSQYGFDHVSHNSHGDWGKHWAHGGYEDKEPIDTDSNLQRP